MLNNLPAPVLFDISVLCTTLSWGIGFYFVDKMLYLFNSLAIGAFVCLIGYTTTSMGAPAWLVMTAPLPVDFYCSGTCSGTRAKC